jgi:AcrR family transcriptional regulator
MRGRKKSEDTRLAILRCAAEVFSEKPYHEVLTDEISARLGVGKGTLYRYFASKEELYFASIVNGLQGMQAAIDETLRQSVPVDRIVEELARTVIGYFWQRRDFFVLLHRHEAKLNDDERVEWQKGRETMITTVGQRLAPELGAGIDPSLAVELLFGMIRSAVLYRDETARIEDLTGLITRVFLNGVRPAPARPLSAPVERRRVAAGKR